MHYPDSKVVNVGIKFAAMSSQEEQLIQFFAYSFFVYPVTNWLVSQPQKAIELPKQAASKGNEESGENGAIQSASRDREAERKEERWQKWKGVLLAIVFLLVVSILHMAYENMEKGPNAYSLLNLSRGSSTSLIKKTYRNLSRELHPDKNKSPNAAEEFQRVKYAFDVVSDPELRKVYNRLGDAGVKTSAQAVIDHKYIMTQMAVYYASTLVFAFLMTFSDASGDAFGLAMFGLVIMLFVETVLVVEEFELPSWFLPYTTSHEVVATLHRVFPAFMNGGRSIIGVFSVNEKEDTLRALQLLDQSMSYVSTKASTMLLQIGNTAMSGGGGGSDGDSGGRTARRLEAQAAEQEDIQQNGLIAAKMKRVARHVAAGAGNAAKTKAEVANIRRKEVILADPALLKASQRAEQQVGAGSGAPGDDGDSKGIVGTLLSLNAYMGEYIWLRNLALYCVVRYLFRGFMPKSTN